MSGIDLGKPYAARREFTHRAGERVYSDRSMTVPGVRMPAKPYDVGDIANALIEELKARVTP
jgi:hypothetical protein